MSTKQIVARRERAVCLQSASNRALIVDLTEEHFYLLQKMRRRSLILSGMESDEEHLSLLQLYVAGFAMQKTDQQLIKPIEWRITTRGRAAVYAANLKSKSLVAINRL
jgi:hypothetical protein